MPFFTKHPRFCAACGTLNMVTPSDPYGGEVCDATCNEVLKMRQARSTMGEPYNPTKDAALWKREGEKT